MIHQVMLLYNAAKLTKPTYGAYHYPEWAVGFGFIIAVVPVLPIPVVAALRVFQASGSLKEVYILGTITKLLSRTSQAFYLLSLSTC